MVFFSLSSQSLLLHLKCPLLHSLYPCITFRSDFSSFLFLLFGVSYFVVVLLYPKLFQENSLRILNIPDIIGHYNTEWAKSSYTVYSIASSVYLLSAHSVHAILRALVTYIVCKKQQNTLQRLLCVLLTIFSSTCFGSYAVIFRVKLLLQNTKVQMRLDVSPSLRND